MSDQPSLALTTLLRGAGSLVGISSGSAAGTVVATLQRDGVTVIDAASQGRLITWALGSSHWTFVTPAVYCGGAQAYAAIVRPSDANAAAAGPTAELWSWRQDASGAVSLERGSRKVQLPSGVVHTLQAVAPPSGHVLAKVSSGTNPDSEDQRPPGSTAAVAVVYTDGSVLSVSLEDSGQQQEKPEVVKLVHAVVDADRAVAATAVDASGSRLAVVLRSAAGGVSACIHNLQPPKDGDAEAAVDTATFQVQPPAAAARVRRAALQRGRLALLWSDGTLQAYELDTAKRKQQEQGQAAAPTASLPLQGFALSGAQVQQQQPAEAAETKVPKKRRKPLANGTVANGVAPQPPRPAPVSPALAILPGDHALVVGWAAEGGGSASAPASGGRLLSAVLELKYGSVRSVASSPAPGSPAEPVSALPLSDGSSDEALVAVLAGATLLTTPVEATPVTLALVLGALALGPQWPPADARPAARAAAAALHADRLPAPPPPPDLCDAQRDASATPDPTSGGRMLRHVQLREPSAAEQPLPDPSGELLACLAVPDGGAAFAEAALEAARKAASLSEPGALRPDAVGAAAAVCAQRGHWDALSVLLQGGVLTSLRVAPALASTLLEAGRLRLFAELLSRAADMGTPELRRVLRLLLRQHSGGAAVVAPAGLAPAAEALAADLRSTAEAVVAAAEVDGGRRHAELAAAAAAAAAVDGFSPEELCMHPLVAAGLDPVVVLEAAQGLAPRQALALLRYLGAWLALHAQLLGGWMHPPRQKRGAGRNGGGGGSGSSRRNGRRAGAAVTAGEAVQAAGTGVGSASSEQQPDQQHIQQQEQMQEQPSQSAAEPEAAEPAAAQSSGRSGGCAIRGRGKVSAGNSAAATADVSAGDAPMSDVSMPDADAAGSSQQRQEHGQQTGTELVPTAANALVPASTAVDSTCGAAAPAGEATGRWPVPPLVRVVEWASAVLDAQLAGLAASAATRQVLEGMRAAVEAQAAEAGRLLRVRGPVEHLRGGAPLPALQDAASLYALEQLDLAQL